MPSMSFITPPTPPVRKHIISTSSIKKRLTCICKQESVDSGGSNVITLKEQDEEAEAEAEAERHQQLKEEQELSSSRHLLPSPVCSGIQMLSSPIATSPVQSEPIIKAQFTVQSKSEQTLRPVYSVAGQQRKSFNAMSDYTSVKPITDYISKANLRRNSLQTVTDLAPKSSGLSRLLSADLSSAEFYAATGNWPKIQKEKLISPTVRIKGPEAIVIEEEKDSESQGSVIAPLLSEQLKAEYEEKMAAADGDEEEKDEKQAGEDEDYDSDYDDYDYDIEENFKYAKRDSQISQTLEMLTSLDALHKLSTPDTEQTEKKLSRSKRLTQKGKKVRRTVFKLSKRIKRKLNGSDKSDKDDEKSQSLEIKEDKSSMSFLDRLTPSPKISKGKHVSSNKASINEPSQEFDKEPSSIINEEAKSDEKVDKQKEEKKEIIDENYQNTKRKLLSRPRALSNIAASLRFAPIPAIAVAGFNLPTDNLMSTEFYSKNKKKDDEEIKKPAKRQQEATSAMPNLNFLSAAFPAKSRKSPMRASYHGKTTYQPGYTDKDRKLLRADAFNVRLQKGGTKRQPENTSSNPEVVGSAESLVSRVLQEQGLGMYAFDK